MIRYFKLTHSKCGGLLGYYKNIDGDPFKSSNFTRSDGSNPEYGSVMKERCVFCNEYCNVRGGGIIRREVTEKEYDLFKKSTSQNAPQGDKKLS
jgi:hypothetical protein